MTERSPRPEVSAFLHDRATAFDRDASPVTADEAARRTIVDASKPGRRWPPALRPAKVRTSPRSALAAAAVVALVVGGLGGFAVGRGSAPKHATVATASAPKTDSAAAPTTTVPSVVANGLGGASVTASGGLGPGMTRLFDRTTSEGIALHGFHGGMIEGSPYGCAADHVVLEAANSGAVGQSLSSSYPLQDAAAITSPLRFGDAEGSPSNGWIVNTSDQVAKVEAHWADGFVDSMTPTGGWAAVAHDGTDANATIVALSNSGEALKTLTANSSSYAQPRAECLAPPPASPSLPPAGAEQPDDPAAARQAITNAYQTVFTHGSDPTTNARYMEDPDSIEQALAAVRANFPQAMDTVTVKVGDIVFTSKSEAALYFELDYQGGAEFGQQVGHATLIDGTWKISRDTMCMVVSWGGGTCGGGSGSAGSSPASPPATPLTTIPAN